MKATGVYIHGLDTSSRGTKGVFFAEKYPEVLREDYFGPFEDRMAKLHRVLADRENLVLVGSSYGGLMAAVFALYHADRVRRIILLAPALTLPEFEPYFDEDRGEEFFVKNLENVQGDERDVMFFSVGYGKDADGNVSLNFGPLNTMGGQRRLNVAVTRARYHVKVITSLTPDDLNMSRAQSQGVRLLREYMEYAQSGGEQLRKREWENVEPSSIELELSKALSKRGLEVDSQVGFSGCGIDLAIMSEQGDRYLLGLECDGPTYRSAKTVRDRERLRREVLEKLGWRVHRVWSRDWILNPEREVKKIIDLVEVMREDLPSYMSAEHEERASTYLSSESGEDVLSLSQAAVDSRAPSAIMPLAAGGTTRPYKQLSREDVSDLIKKYSSSPAAAEREMLARTVNLEGPIHRIGATRRLGEFYGMLKRPKGKELSRVAAAQRIGQAIDEAQKHGLIDIRGDFLWPVEMKAPLVRISNNGEWRDIGEVAPEELELAVLSILGPSFETVEAVVSRTSRLMGYDPGDERVRSRMEMAVMRLVDKHILEFGDRCVCLAGHSDEKEQEGEAFSTAG